MSECGRSSDPGKCPGRSGPSLEEEDLVRRSIKKPKGDSIEDEAMDDEMREKGDVEDNLKASEVELVPGAVVHAREVTHGCKQAKKTVSYRDKLLLFNGEGNSSDHEEESWMEKQKREEEEEDLEDVMEEEEEDPLCPSYKVPKSQHKEDCRQWRKALIVKLLGKQLNPKFLVQRLHGMWNLMGTYEMIDLDMVICCSALERMGTTLMSWKGALG